jgi:hypothetical protein
MKKEKSCKDCLMGTHINVNNDILCRLKGAVSPDYVCPRHKSAPPRRSVQKDVPLQRCLDCEFFVADGVSPEDHLSIGFCQLFTVRHFNGEYKKACSRFSLRAGTNETEVSKTG